MTKTLDKLYADLRRDAVENRHILSDRDIDKAIMATVSQFIEKEFGHRMNATHWQDKVSINRGRN